MDQSSWDTILQVMPSQLRHMLQDAICDPASLTELRIRRGQNVQIISIQDSFFLDAMFTADENFCAHLLENITKCSLFSVQHQMAQGYITLPQGIRVGIGGRFIRLTDKQGEHIAGVMPVTSFCFRVAHPCVGAASQVMQCLLKDDAVPSALVISPPGAGKTTLLRDMTRIASNMGKRVVLIDERGELSGWHEGEAAFDIGSCTDVLYDLEKSRAIMLAVRTLSPDIIVCDELGAEKDAAAIQEAVRCGVSIFASAHAPDVESLLCRPMLRACMKAHVFSHIVVLEREKKGVIQEIRRIGNDAACGFSV